MKPIRLLRAKQIQQLSESIADNLDAYRSGDFEFLASDPACFIEIASQYDELALANVTCTKDDHKEVECCMNIFAALGGISAYLARDPRLWISLTHTDLLDYARARWPIPEKAEDAVAHIKKHFFANGMRGIERDNAASRMWWMASLCSKVDGLSLKDALTVLLHDYDVRANIIERPTTSQSVQMFSAVIKKLHDCYVNDMDKKLFQRERFRPAMKELNLLGGTKLLSAMNNAEVVKIVDSCLK